MNSSKPSNDTRLNGVLDAPRASRALALTLGAILAAGCATIETPQIRESDIPLGWSGPIDEEAQIWPQLEWWHGFDSPELTALVEQVQESNITLANNRRNLEAAQIQLEAAGIDLWPTPNLSLSTGTSFTERRSDGSTVSSGSSSGPFQLSASANYGNILSKPVNYRRAVAVYDSSIASAVNTRLATLTQAASAYFSLLLIRDRIVAGEQNVVAAERVHSFVQARVEAGVIPPLDELQQRIEVENARISLDNLRQQEYSTLASLALLLGRRVDETLDIEGQTLAEIAVPSVAPGIPSDLMLRRPDLVQAEASLRSATANLQIARRALFPQISLTSSNSATSSSLANLISSGDTALNIGASLAQTLLDNGARGRNIESAELSLETSLANYRESVLRAFNEVETLLRNLELVERQSAIVQQQLESAERAFDIAELRYQQGVASLETVLRAQNALFNQRTSVLQNRQQRLNTILDLYRALGGGWSADTPLPATMFASGEQTAAAR